MRNNPEYVAWVNMRRRCLHKNGMDYPNYAGRGIFICDRWLDSFDNFLRDMGLRPNPKYTLERIDNNGNYEPDNCIWATRTKQGRNTRRISLSLEKADEIRRLYRQGGINQTKLADIFKVNQTTISDVIRNTVWKG
jgi:hypothetical protein